MTQWTQPGEYHTKEREAKFDVDEKVLRSPHEANFKQRSLRLHDIAPNASDSSSSEYVSGEEDEGREKRIRELRSDALARANSIQGTLSLPSTHIQHESRDCASPAHQPLDNNILGKNVLPDPDAIFEPNSIRLQQALLAAEEEQAEWYDYDPNSNIWATKPATIRKISLNNNDEPTHISVREIGSSRWVS